MTRQTPITEVAPDNEQEWCIFVENREAVIAALEAGQCDGILPAARGFLDGFAGFCLQAGVLTAFAAFPDRRARSSIPMLSATVGWSRPRPVFRPAIS